MARIKLSREAAMKAIAYSSEARDQLLSNAGILDNNVNSQFSGLTDPSIKKYVQLSEQMHGTLRQLGAKMDEISEYCKKVIRWIDEYSEG